MEMFEDDLEEDILDEMNRKFESHLNKVLDKVEEFSGLGSLSSFSWDLYEYNVGR